MGIIDPALCVELDKSAELCDTFRRNLRGSLRDARALDYVVDVLVQFSEECAFDPVFGERPFPVIIDELWANPDKMGSYNKFKGYADAFLWVCGFLPENVSKSRRSKPGLERYIQFGRDAYEGAIYLAGSLRISNQPVEAMCRVSRGFEQCSRAILEMRARLNVGSAMLPYETVDEISRVLYRGENAAIRLAQIAGRENPGLRVVQ